VQSQFETEEFALPEHEGELSQAWKPIDLEATVAGLVDPSSTTETLYWGRNYLYGAQVETEAAPIAVAVKQFRNQGLGRRLERKIKGSKAQRSWRGALALMRAGVATPDPVLLIESRQAAGPSFYVSKRLTGFVEARYYFRSLETRTERLDYPDIDPNRLMELLGRSIRRLHDAGVWHRDLSIGNLLLMPSDDSEGEMTVYFIDLNRARTDRRLTVSQRTRDLCRLRIFRRPQQEILLRSYWDGRLGGFGLKTWLYRFYFNGFLVKIWLKGVLRAPFRWLAALVPRRPHAHIPAAPNGTSKRDRVVWDGLSDQPHQQFVITRTT